MDSIHLPRLDFTHANRGGLKDPNYYSLSQFGTPVRQVSVQVTAYNLSWCFFVNSLGRGIDPPPVWRVEAGTLLQSVRQTRLMEYLAEKNWAKEMDVFQMCCGIRNPKVNIPQTEIFIWMSLEGYVDHC